MADEDLASWLAVVIRDRMVDVGREHDGVLGEALRMRELEAKHAHGDDVTAEDLIARDAVDAIIAPVLWGQALGEMYDTGQVMSILGISRQAVALRVRHHSLLAVPGRRSRQYPEWQFGHDDGVWPIVPTILRRWYQAEPEVEPATIALWAITSTHLSEDDDVTPAWLIRSGRSDELVLRLVDDIVARRTM